MKNKFEIFLDTDILLEHYKKGSESVLTKCISIFDACYTSVINASELFSMYPEKEKEERIKGLFSNVGILGIPFRYSVKIGKVSNVIKKKSPETLSGTL